MTVVRYTYELGAKASLDGEMFVIPDQIATAPVDDDEARTCFIATDESGGTHTVKLTCDGLETLWCGTGIPRIERVVRMLRTYRSIGIGE